MEVLLEESHYAKTASIQRQFSDLIVGVLQDQQCLSIVVIIDALDECFSEDVNRLSRAKPREC